MHVFCVTMLKKYDIQRFTTPNTNALIAMQWPMAKGLLELAFPLRVNLTSP